MKDPNWRNRYTAAVRYYENEDYYRAGILLEDILPIIRGKKEAEQANYYHADCYFQQGQYIMSAYYFKQFHDTYRRSSRAVEALYYYAYSLYLDSPTSNLDQTNTHKAINALQDFINRYPTNEYVKKADILIAEMQIKLEQKAFDVAKLYYDLAMYQSAVIAFDNFQKDYPDSYLQEEVAFLKVQASFEYADKSYYSFQKERYEDVFVHYEKMLERFPDSKYLKEAQIYFENTQKGLRKLQKTINEMEEERGK